MVRSSYSILFVCLVFLTFQQMINGLKCYDCTECDTVDGNTATVEVSDNSQYSCYKLVNIIGGNEGVNRGARLNCVPWAVHATNIGRQGNFCCQTDSCNSAMSHSIRFGLLAFIITTSMILRMTIFG